jgi:hypothetical protein
MAPETQQMADLSDAAAARERRRNALVTESATVGIEGALTLEHLRALVAKTDTWPGESTIDLREYSSHPGEPGSTPDRITITRKANDT